MTLEQGAILHGRYRIVEILGQGGMGSVYRAIDENLGVEVAVKENLFTTDEYARQFRLEAVILASLRQPNLPRVTDHFVVNGQGQYLVMDYIEGEDLRQRMERLGNIPEEEAILIGASICDALAYLHTRKPPVLHRDLKPGNVKITPEGHVYLVDFGLAKVMRGSQATTTGARAMTPGYSPPEQYGTARTDAHSDIYSLGATLYAALTGVIPEDGLARVMDNVELTPLRKRNPKVSRKLAAAIEKAMEPYPDDRFQSDEDFKEALLAASTKTQKPNGDLVVPTPPVSTDRPPSKPLAAIENAAGKVENTPARLKRRRKRSLGWLAFSLLLVLIIVLLLGLVINYPVLIPPQAARILPAGWLPSPTATVTLASTKLPTTETKAVAIVTQATATPTRGPTKRTTNTPTNTSTPTLTPSPTITPTLIGGGLGTIAFASSRSGIPQIYLMNADGTNQQAITTESDGACQPHWSPDGTQIVYVSPCTLKEVKEAYYSGSNLYIMNADGSGKTPLGGSVEGDYDPVWSPDGKSIAFTSLRDGYPQIYSLNLQTKEVIRLTQTEANVQTMQPAWSPDGTQIAYTLRRVGVFQIWVMTSAGKAQQQLVRSGSQLSDFLPAWSPDGAFLSFSQTDSFAISPSPAWLMTMRYEDRKSQTSVKVNADPPIVDVDYSPDGYWLVFESVSADPAGSNQDIYLMTISGGDRTRLTRDPDLDFDPVWKPNPTPAVTATPTPTP